MTLQAHFPIPSRARRGPPPSISSLQIYEHTLRVLDEEGQAAITVRRLAHDLAISTRTLYKRIGSQDQLLQNVIELHVARLNPRIARGEPWRALLVDWCMELHRQMCEHPHSTALLAQRDHIRLAPRIADVAAHVASGGVSSWRPHQLCRWTTQVAYNAAIVATRPAPEPNVADLLWSGTRYTNDLRSILTTIVFANDRNRADGQQVEIGKPHLPTLHESLESSCP